MEASLRALETAGSSFGPTFCSALLMWSTNAMAVTAHTNNPLSVRSLRQVPLGLHIQSSCPYQPLSPKLTDDSSLNSAVVSYHGDYCTHRSSTVQTATSDQRWTQLDARNDRECSSPGYYLFWKLSNSTPRLACQK